MITIYHNPRCSKSREGLQVLEQQDKPFTVVKYLSEEFTKNDLAALISTMGIKPIELVRQNETIWKEQFKGAEYSDDEVIDILLQHPNLIERPIVSNGIAAVIARPADRMNSLL